MFRLSTGQSKFIQILVIKFLRGTVIMIFIIAEDKFLTLLI